MDIKIWHEHDDVSGKFKIKLEGDIIVEDIILERAKDRLIKLVEANLGKAVENTFLKNSVYKGNLE